MDILGTGVKKLLLAGIGTVAATAEKSKEVLDELVKKGELTVEQGKILNQELKHNIRQAMKERADVPAKESAAEDLNGLLGKMTPEQLEALKQQIAGMEKQKEGVSAQAADTEET